MSWYSCRKEFKTRKLDCTARGTVSPLAYPLSLSMQCTCFYVLRLAHSAAASLYASAVLFAARLASLDCHPHRLASPSVLPVVRLLCQAASHPSLPSALSLSASPPCLLVQARDSTVHLEFSRGGTATFSVCRTARCKEWHQGVLHQLKKETVCCYNIRVYM